MKETGGKPRGGCNESRPYFQGKEKVKGTQPWEKIKKKRQVWGRGVMTSFRTRMSGEWVRGDGGGWARTAKKTPGELILCRPSRNKRNSLTQRFSSGDAPEGEDRSRKGEKNDPNLCFTKPERGHGSSGRCAEAKKSRADRQH